jgi:nicotinate-nucleotide pyrophosphorylase (carboxylating)
MQTTTTTAQPASKPKVAFDFEQFQEQLIDQSITLAMLEDLGPDNIDITTSSVAPADALATGYLQCKQKAVIAGLEIFKYVMKRYDGSIEVKELISDGETVDSPPTKLATLRGNAQSILKAERLGLNLLQRMSGVATETKALAQKAAEYKIAILDTRKTTPGLRVFEKRAVAIAGGTNHRFGLFDAILIKDNHVRLAGGVAKAVELARKKNPALQIEVETTTLDEVKEALALKAEQIMLDNMTPDMVQQAVVLIGGRAFIEVSGGINASNLDQYLLPGVNAISIGALTHSAKNIDISLEVEIHQ